MLETAAAQAGQRGDAATAMAAFERAARLTANEAARGAYLIHAAEMAFSLAADEGALRLLRQAEGLDLTATDRDNSLVLSVRDDGVGGVDPSRGSGIVGLTDRVEALGGSLRVASRPGKGTRITAELPLQLK